MQLTAPINNRIGTCPHGLSPGGCPICSGMGGGGGGAKKADFSAKPGEMSWNECAAIGAFLKAQQTVNLAKNQDIQNFAQNIQAFQANLANAGQKLADFAQLISNTMPAIIAKPINFLLNNIVGGVLNIIKEAPIAIINTIQTIVQKFADISDKLAAVMGELKAAVEKKISDAFKTLKKKFKSLFGFFEPIEENEKTYEIERNEMTKQTTGTLNQIKSWVASLSLAMTQETQNNKTEDTDEY